MSDDPHTRWELAQINVGRLVAAQTASIADASWAAG